MTENPPLNNGSATQLQKVLKAIAAAGIIFTAVFLALLIINGYKQYVKNTGAATELVDLKRELLKAPDNETLIKRIRELDRDYRAERLRSLDFSSLGALLLLISASVTIGAIKVHDHIKGINPVQYNEAGEPYLQRKLKESRIALCLLVVLLAGASFILGQKRSYEWIREVNAGISEKPAFASPEELALNWNRFRGFGGAGISALTDIPSKWDGASGEGILWKTPIPLKGFSSPIVWNDRVFLSGGNEEKRQVYCFDASTGAILWTGDVPAAPMGDEKIEVMEDTGYAASTMATDGYRVYAIFATGDLASFDFKGRLLWHKSLGVPVSLYGYASSLEVWQDRVIVQYDQAGAGEGKSRLFAFNGATGTLVWEAKRDLPNSWTSPVIADTGKGYQLITVGDPWVIAYDPDDGKEIWAANCIKGDVGASPIVAGDLAIAIAPDLHNVAIRTDGKGDVTATHIKWINDDVGPTIVSPVSDGSSVFYLDTYGTLYNIALEDGKPVYEHDFNENVNASPTIVSGKMYILSVEGNMFIGTAGEKAFQVEAINPLGEECYATPAFMPGRIYIRAKEHLYCIGK